MINSAELLYWEGQGCYFGQIMFRMIKSFVFKHKLKLNLKRPMHWTFLNESIGLPVSSRSALAEAT